MMGNRSTHEELMAACQHRALLAQIVGGVVKFYQCSDCAARFDHRLVPYENPPEPVK